MFQLVVFNGGVFSNRQFVWSARKSVSSYEITHLSIVFNEKKLPLLTHQIVNNIYEHWTVQHKALKEKLERHGLWFIVDLQLITETS